MTRYRNWRERMDQHRIPVHRPDKPFDMVPMVRDGHRPRHGPYAIATPHLVTRERLTYSSLPFVMTRYEKVKSKDRKRVIAIWKENRWQLLWPKSDGPDSVTPSS